jgi:hypothetical protein
MWFDLQYFYMSASVRGDLKLDQDQTLRFVSTYPLVRPLVTMIVVIDDHTPYIDPLYSA